MSRIFDCDTDMSMVSSTALMVLRFGSSSKKLTDIHSIWVSSRKVRSSFLNGFILMVMKHISWYILRKQKHIGLAPIFISRPWPTTNEALNFLLMEIKDLEGKIAEYENRLVKIADESWYDVLMNHTLIHRETGTLASWGTNSIRDRDLIAYASVVQTTHNNLAFMNPQK